MAKKILFVQPTPYDTHGRLIKKSKLYFVGLSLPLLAALTPDEYICEIVIETIEDIDFDSDADIIAVSSMGHAVIRTLDIAREFKRRGKTVVLGGYMVSLMPEEADKYCDAVVIGDAEEVWGELLADYERGTLKQRYSRKLTQLDPPIPRYELLLDKRIGDFLPVQAGRGCPNVCTFCSVYCLYKTQYLKRPVPDVIRDIKRVKELGFERFLLLDDNILADREYLLELCTEIKQLGMQWLSQCSVQIGEDSEVLRAVAESGCVALSFGLESISQSSLDSLNKSWASVDEYERLLRNIREAGIDLSTEMVVGAEGDTLESIKATAEFIRRNKIVVPRFYILTPIPGTEFYEEMMAENRIYKHDIYAYNGTEAVHIPKNMTPEELTQAYWELYNEVFTIRSIVSRTLLHKDLFRRPLSYLFYLAVNLYYRHQIRHRITPNII